MQDHDSGGDDLLRHTVATLAYRAAKTLRDVPDDFADHQPAPATRTPLAIVSHLGDLMEWAARMARGEVRWQAVPAVAWGPAVDRFFAGLAAFERALAATPPVPEVARQLFQGPIADALTHVGQLAMLRGLAGRAIRPESYAKADVRAGVVGPAQPPPRREFDGDASKPAR